MVMQSEKARSRLEGLSEVCHLLMDTLDAGDLVKVVLGSAVRLFSAEACSIGLIDPIEGHLVFAFTEGGAEVGEFRLQPGQGIIGWVAQSGEGVVCNDVSRDSRFFGEVDRKTGFKTKSVLCAPLKRHGQILGAIEILNTASPEGFTQEDIQLLNALGELAAAAIHRAKLFNTERNKSQAFQEAIQDRYRLIASHSKAMRSVIGLAQTVAAKDTTMLLLGENGTGKEVLARFTNGVPVPLDPLSRSTAWP